MQLAFSQIRACLQVPLKFCRNDYHRQENIDILDCRFTTSKMVCKSIKKRIDSADIHFGEMALPYASVDGIGNLGFEFKAQDAKNNAAFFLERGVA